MKRIQEIWIYIRTLISQGICRLATGINCPLYTSFRERRHSLNFMIFPEHGCQRGPSMRAKSISSQRRTQPGFFFHLANNYTNWLIAIHTTNLRVSVIQILARLMPLFAAVKWEMVRIKVIHHKSFTMECTFFGEILLSAINLQTNCERP